MKKSKIRIILEDNWEGFLKKGYIEFKCDKCNETKKVGFTCKIRFSTSCGKIYVDNWIGNMLGNLINVKHRHIVFTIPEELREYFQRDRQKLKILPKCVEKAIMS